MSTPESRQLARDRAADAFAPHETVVVGPNGWSPRILHAGITPAERKRRDRARKADAAAKARA